jgi:hypothetical protein
LKINKNLYSGVSPAVLLGKKKLDPVASCTSGHSTTLYLTDMSKEFLGSLQGCENPIVQHIHNIHVYESSNSQAGKFHFLGMPII